MKGRPAIPQKLHDLRGGRAHTHRAPRNEPNPPESIPTCPDHLNDVARKEWERVVTILADVGIMTELDRTTLAAYCEAYSRWQEATWRMNAEGLVTLQGGIPKANPYIKIGREAYDQMIKTGTLLGMSPSSRASIGIAQEKKSPAQDKTEKFRLLKNGKNK